MRGSPYFKSYIISFFVMVWFCFPVFGNAGLLDSLLDHLHDPVQAVIADWIEVKDIVHLDTSACNRHSSPSLREVMKKAQLSSPMIIRKGPLSFQAFSERLIKLSKLKYISFLGECEIFPNEDLKSILQCSGSGERVFSNLVSLELNSCTFSESTLQILAHCCPNIKKLGLEGIKLYYDDRNQLSQESGPPLQFKNLKKLMISYDYDYDNPDGSQLRDETLNTLIKGCENLTFLSLIRGTNDLSRDYFSGMQAKNLVELRLLYCRGLTDTNLNLLLKGCENLQVLELDGNDELTGDFCFRVPAKNLVELKLVYCSGLTNTNLNSFLKGCENLRVLQLESNHELTGDFLSCVQLKNIEELTLLEFPDLMDKNLSAFLNHCKNLRVLSLTQTDALTGAFLSGVQAENIKELDLSSCPGLTEANLTTFFNRCKNLKVLRLAYNDQFTQDCLSGVSFKHLKDLTVIACSKILTSESFKDLVKACPELTTLQSDNFGNTHLSFVRSLLNEPYFSSLSPENTEELNMSGCTYMDDANVSYMLKRYPRIKKLNLNGNDQLTEACLSGVSLNHLEELSVNGSPGILTSENFVSVFKACPELKKLNYNGKFTGRDRGFVASSLRGSGVPSVRAEHKQELSISGYPCLDDKVLSDMFKFYLKIERLRLSDHAQLTGAFFSGVQTENLGELTVLRCAMLTDENLNIFLKRCKNLRFLHLMGNDQLTGSCLSRLNLENLEVLHVSDSPGILTKEHFVNIVKSCPNLKRLGSDNKFTTKEFAFVRSLLTGHGLVLLENMQTLTIPECHLDDDVIAEFLKPYLRLERLNLMNHTQLTGAFFSGVQTENLGELTVLRCATLTNENLNIFLKRCKNLKVLRLIGNDQLTGDCLSGVSLNNLDVMIGSCGSLLR